MDFIQRLQTMLTPDQGYTRSELFRLRNNVARRPKLSGQVFKCIQDLGISRIKRRTTRGGKCVKLKTFKIKTIVSNRCSTWYVNSSKNTCDLIRICTSKTIECLKLLKTALLNARSICNKSEDIKDFIVDNDIDILCITETWLSGDDRDNIVIAQITPPGYAIYQKARKGKGGGVAVILKDSLRVKQKSGGRCSSFEHIELLISTPAQYVRLVVVYRPPSCSKTGTNCTVFGEEFENYIADLITSSGNLLITGDFNFHYQDNNNQDANKFRSLLSSISLQQHVTEATHDSGHVLDLIITRISELDIQHLQVHPSALSDHSAITFTLPLNKPKTDKQKITVRKWKDVDIQALCCDLRDSDLIAAPNSDLDTLIEQYNNTINNIMNSHAPPIEKILSIRRHAPWYNDEIKRAKTARRKAERNWRSNKLTISHDLFKTEHYRVINLNKEAKIQYYRQQFEDCGTDQKKIFTVAEKLLFRKQSRSLPCYDNPSDLANNFASFFTNKIKKANEDILKSQPANPEEYSKTLNNSPPLLNHFQPVTEQQIRQIITASNSKSCALDPLPTHLLKSCVDVLLTPICNIINSSIASGKVPTALKHATITPILKKPSLDKDDFKSYRPISNLPYVSKILEKTVVKQLNDHIEKYGLQEPLQSAYRQNHSTETALVKVFNDLLCCMDTKQSVMLVLLDLSAAFDTVDHNIMLDRLHHNCGITDTCLQWLSSYFSDRTQSVVIDGLSSSPHALTTGVPQGSVVGPFTFPQYLQPVSEIAKNYHTSVHFYADDTQLYRSFNLNSYNETKSDVECCVEKVKLWMASNMLKFNDAKTEYLTIGSPYNVKHCPSEMNTIKVGSHEITACNSARNIGCVMDTHLTMQAHINSVSRACYHQLRNIANNRRYLTLDTTKTLVHALVCSRIDSLNALYFGLPDNIIHKLQVIQNNAARVIAQKKKRDHITETLYNLHWLPIRFRIDYKINLLTFKCLNGLAPQYLADLITYRCPARALRSADRALLTEPRSRTTYGDRAFSICAPRLWNKLPSDLCNISDIDTFKLKLKTHLFKTAFSSILN